MDAHAGYTSPSATYFIIQKLEEFTKQEEGKGDGKIERMTSGSDHFVEMHEMVGGVLAVPLLDFCFYSRFVFQQL